MSLFCHRINRNEKVSVLSQEKNPVFGGGGGGKQLSAIDEILKIHQAGNELELFRREISMVLFSNS